jgi:diguanylate cyclase (GGDEF)-like protein/PAS domain S-box-containing protein
MYAGAPPPKDLTQVARACGVFAIVLGLVIAVGWALQLDVLTSVAPSLPNAMLNSGAMFVACGASLIALASGRTTLGIGGAAFVVALSGATLVEYALDVDLGVDNPLGVDFGAMTHPGRPATHTVAAFMLLGCCLAAARWHSRLGDAVAGVLGAGAAASVGVAVAGYLIGVDYLRGNATTHGMSVHTAAGLVIVLVGAFALRPRAAPGSWYARSGGGEVAARHLMGPSLVLPFVLGGLVQAGASLDLYSERFGLSLMVVAVAALIQGLIYLAVDAVGEHESASRMNLQRFTTLTREAPVGIFETDAAGRPTFVNDRWVEITGITPEEAIMGRSALHPDDRDWVQREWQATAAAGGDWSQEVRFLRADGEVRWVSVHGTALRDEAGEVTSFIGSVLDVTDRRLAEERTGMVVRRIAEAVSIIGPDGTYLHVNEAGDEINRDLNERYRQQAIADFEWGAIDADGNPVPNHRLPAEITRRTGREIDACVVGFPRPDGDVRWLRISSRRMSEDGPPYAVIVSFSDVTEQRQADAALAEAQKRFELAFDHAPIGIALVTLEGRLVRVNRALCEMFGYAEGELVGERFQELTDEEGLTDDLDELGRMIAGEIPSYQMEKRYGHKDGSDVWALLSVSLVRGDADKPLYFIAQILDITDRRRLERELRHQADHDNLTGLANRRAFGTQLGRELARERRYGGESSLLMIDLDGFKEINDTIGHAAGDLVLIAVAELISERVRDTDVAARLGGDEFAVLLPNTDRRGAEILAIDLVQAVRELRVDVGADEPACVTASVGVACSAELPQLDDEDALLIAADVAMYEAKRTGRDGYAVHGA